MPTSVRVLSDLPESVRRFLADTDAFVFYDELRKRYGLPESAPAEFDRMVHELALGRLELADVLDELFLVFGTEDDVNKKVAVELANVRLMPLSNLVGDVVGAIQSWGGEARATAPGEAFAMPGAESSPELAQALETVGIRLRDEVLEHRLELIVGAWRNKERNEQETQAVLTRPVKLGGMGFEQEVAKEFLSVIARSEPKANDEAISASNLVGPQFGASPTDSQLSLARHGAPRPQTPTRPIFELSAPKPVADFFTYRSEDAQEIAAQEKKLEQLLDRVEHGASSTPVVPPAAREKLQELVAQKEQEVFSKRYAEITGDAPREHVEPVAPDTARVTMAKPKAVELLEKEERIDTQKVREAVQAAQKMPPLAARVRYSEPSLAAPVAPRVDDVRPVRRIKSPVDELGTMTVADFRRLAREPQEAAQRIREKLDILQQERYEQRIAGLKAFRQSPLFFAYRSLASEALAGGSNVLTLAATRSRQDANALTQEEVQAIVALNRELRF